MGVSTTGMGGAAASPERVRDAVGFLLRLGRALHSSGYGADDVEYLLRRGAGQLGLEAQFFYTPTTILAAFGPQEQQQIHLMRVEPGDPDLGRLADLNEVSTAVLRGAMTAGEGAARVDAIVAANTSHGPWTQTLGYAAASAASARFLGGGVDEIAVAAIIGLAVGVLALWAAVSPGLARVFAPVAAFMASVIATLAAAVLGPVSGYIAMLAGVIVLLPGLSLTLAMSELSANHLVSGTARLSSTLLRFLGLGFGAALGAALVQEAVISAPAARPETLPMWTVWAAVVVAAMGFTLVYRAKARDAIWILLVSAAAYAAYRWGAHELSFHVGAFLGALTAGVASNLYARYLKRPEMVTQVPGLLLLVPGSIGFHSLAALLDRNVETSMQSVLQMALTAIALAAGLVVANGVVPPRRG